MGHERVGALPHTKRWRAIVDAIVDFPAGEAKSDISSLAENTLRNVSDRFRRIHEDKGVQAAFGYLVSLATAHLPPGHGVASPKTGLDGDPSPVRIAKNLNDWVKQHASSQEYAELACRAAADTVSEWTRAHSGQHLLFDEGNNAAKIWAKSASGQGFCEVGRNFFAHFTERYLRYFLEREASSRISSIEARQQFNQRLHNHIDDVSKHAFETSKITQSFAAGWFNNHARNARPTDREIEGFLAIAFGKVYEELQREAGK